MKTIGIDPDTKSTAYAILEDGKLTHVGVIKGKGLLAQVDGFIKAGEDYIFCNSLMHDTHFVVENQQIYAGKTKNPDSILKLAQVAGGIVGVLCAEYETRISMPKPREWKKCVPKQIHQARILSRLGWEYKKSGSVKDGYCYPVGAKFEADKKGIDGAEVRKTDWKHIVDAIGLAQWGEKQ